MTHPSLQISWLFLQPARLESESDTRPPLRNNSYVQAWLSSPLADISPLIPTMKGLLNLYICTTYYIPSYLSRKYYNYFCFFAVVRTCTYVRESGGRQNVVCIPFLIINIPNTISAILPSPSSLRSLFSLIHLNVSDHQSSFNYENSSFASEKLHSNPKVQRFDTVFSAIPIHGLILLCRPARPGEPVSSVKKALCFQSSIFYHQGRPPFAVCSSKGSKVENRL